MTERPSNRPGKSEPWPQIHRKIIMQLQPPDRVFFRSTNPRGIPAGVGASNHGKSCLVIVGHKEIEGLKLESTFRDLEEFSGSSVDICPGDIIFSSVIDAAGSPYAVGHQNKGKDVTIILFSGQQEEADKSTENETELRKLQAEFMKAHEQLNKLAEQINALEKGENKHD